MSEIERLRRMGVIATAPERARVELVVTGIEGLSIRYYSEGRHAEFVKLQPMMRELLLRATGY